MDLSLVLIGSVEHSLGVPIYLLCSFILVYRQTAYWACKCFNTEIPTQTWLFCRFHAEKKSKILSVLSTTNSGKFRIHTPTRSFQSKLVKQVLHLLVENIELSTNSWLQFLFCLKKCSQIVVLAESFGSISVLYMYSEMSIEYKRKVSQLIVFAILT